MPTARAPFKGSDALFKKQTSWMHFRPSRTIHAVRPYPRDSTLHCGQSIVGAIAVDPTQHPEEAFPICMECLRALKALGLLNDRSGHRA